MDHPTIQNPFANLRIRTLVFILIGTFPFLVLTLFLSNKITGINDALIESVATTLWFYGIILLWMKYQFKKNQISWKALIGNFPEHFGWGSSLGLLICMLLFNFGSLIASLGLLSYIFPDYVVSFMNDRPNDQTLAPGLFILVDTLIAVMIAPIVEELLMRGVFLHRFQSKWGIKIAILLGSAIFAVGHANIIGMFMVALVMSILYLKYKTLIIPIFFHAMNNIVVSLLQLSSNPQQSAKPATLWDIQTSLWFGLVLVVISLPVLLRFLIKNWPRQDLVLPYPANSAK